MIRDIRLSAKAWLMIPLFQVVYGLAIFGATRAVYTSDDPMQSTRIVQRERYHDSAEGALTASAMQRLMPGSGIPSPLDSIDDPKTFAQLADDSFRDKNYQRAASYYAKVLELSPRNVDAYNNLGLTLHYVGRSTEAIQKLQQGIAIDEGHQRIWLTLGFVHAQVGNVSDARDALQRTIDLDSKSEVGLEAASMIAQLP